MSLIHEALKKAEAQRRLGEPPTLGTPIAGARRRRPLLPVLGGLIAVALGAGWWLSSRNAIDDAPQAAAPGDLAPAPANTPPQAYNQPTKTTGPRVNETALSSAADRHPVGSANPAQPPGSRGIGAIAPVTGPINQSPPSRPATPQEIAERESEPHPAGTNPLAPGEAAPVALGAPPPATAPNDPAALAAKQKAKEQAGPGVAATPAPAAAKAPADAAPATAPVKSVITKPAPPPAAPAATPVATAPPPAKPAAAPATPPATPIATPPAPAQPVAQAPQQPPLEQLPLYWQLPLNVRKDLPALKLSMHVYSATPAQRFVILNGNRQKEGDDLGADVRLNEIRADGAVLEFHGQRFLVPRGGS